MVRDFLDKINARRRQSSVAVSLKLFNGAGGFDC
jgi:hypothetical protein